MTPVPLSIRRAAEVCGDRIDQDCDGQDAVCDTPTGTNIVAQPVDTTTGTTPLTLTFSEVTQAGITSLTTSSAGPPPDPDFALGDPPIHYDLTTTAVFSGPITVCIKYSGVKFTSELQLKLFHFKGGRWVNPTVSLDTTKDIICAKVASLSPFAIFAPVTVPFAAFAAKAEIEDDGFELKAVFTLGADSDGIDPPMEEVSFQVGAFALTIPPNSLSFKPAKPSKKGKPGKPAKYKFKGVIDSVLLEVKITQLGTNSFEFKAEAEGADLSGTVNPVPIALLIGDDSGSTTVTVKFKDEDDKEQDD